MNTLAWVLGAVTVVVAVVDWVAVHLEHRPLEYVAKPLTMVTLIGATLALDPVDTTARWWFVVALVCSLAGDVFLMLPKPALFVAGLGSFLLGHVAYIVGLRFLGFSSAGFVIAVLIVALTVPVIGSRIVSAVRAGEEEDLAIPVTAYMVVISAMVVSAGATGVAIALVGALLFYASDALIGWTRFRQEFAHGGLAIITTYHLGQLALVASLVAA